MAAASLNSPTQDSDRVRDAALTSPLASCNMLAGTGMTIKSAICPTFTAKAHCQAHCAGRLQLPAGMACPPVTQTVPACRRPSGQGSVQPETQLKMIQCAPSTAEFVLCFPACLFCPMQDMLEVPLAFPYPPVHSQASCWQFPHPAGRPGWWPAAPAETTSVSNKHSWSGC